MPAERKPAIRRIILAWGKPGEGGEDSALRQIRRRHGNHAVENLECVWQSATEMSEWVYSIPALGDLDG
jgi:hypothetical protein